MESKKKKIAICFGTRPEVIKLFPVIKELKKSFKVIIISTGQQKELSSQMLQQFGIVPDYSLEVMSANQQLTGLISRLHLRIGHVFDVEKPDAVIVQGDTTTTLVACLESYFRKIPVAHVEAGLRTSDIYAPFPEEGFRRMISQIASYNFTPTNLATSKLVQEEVLGEVLQTGNTGIDTLLAMKPKSQETKKKIILVTLHRRESFGQTMVDILEAIKQFISLYPEVEILFPLHPNPNVRGLVKGVLGNHSQVKLVPALGYLDMLQALQNCYFIMTDSGGIQEEAPSLNKPVLVLRNQTERPELIDIKAGLLVGTKPEDILAAAIKLMDGRIYNSMINKENPYGDGKASEHIREYLEEVL